MTIENLKARLQHRWASIKTKFGSPFVVAVITVAVCAFFFVSFQKSCDSRTEQREDERIKAYERELEQKNAEFRKYLEMANADHRTTTMILDAMNEMSKNINSLAENDRAITARVNQIAESEYAAARNQKNNQAATKTGKAKNAKPVRVREIEALKVDEELYPNE